MSWRSPTCARRFHPRPSESVARFFIRTFANFGRHVVDVLNFDAMSTDQITGLIDVVGEERVKQAMARGQGVICCAAHFGYWELHAMVHAMLFRPLLVVARTLDNPLVDGLIERIRSRLGTRAIPRQGAVRGVLRALMHNESVAIMIDQHMEDRSAVAVDFFNRPAATTSAVAALSLRTGAPILPVFALPLPGGRYRMIYETPVEVPAADDPDPIRTYTQRCTDVLEMYVRRYPDQWLWMHRRWASGRCRRHGRAGSCGCGFSKGCSSVIERLLGLVDAVGGKQVAVIGDVIADEFIYGELSRVSREAPVLILKYDATTVLPGGAGNAAANVAALGGRARLVGLVGRQEVDRRLVRSLPRGVDRSGLVRPREYRSPVKTRILAGGLHSARQQVVRIDREAQVPEDSRTRSDFERAVRHALVGCDGVLVSDYGSGLVTPCLVSGIKARLARSGRRRAIPILVDSRYQLLRYRGLTACTPNESEVEQMLETTIGDDPQKAGASRPSGPEADRLERCGSHARQPRDGGICPRAAHGAYPDLRCG